MKPTPIISDHDLTLLREVRRLAAEVSDCASLLYWETSFPDTIRARFDTAVRSLSVLLPTAQATFAPATFAPATFAPATFAPATFAPATFAPATRTRYSWDGNTVTSHVESV